MAIKAIRGFRDILPGETPRWRLLETTAQRVFQDFGFREIRIPVVERTELFARSIGADTDIVEKEMFTFPDRHDDLMTLRPEATAGITRSMIEHNLAADGRPLKLFFIGPMFRYERPQKGRQRQFHQLDVEVFNDPTPHADAEIITALSHFLGELDLGEVTMNINSLGCPRCRPGYKAELKAYLESRREGLCPDCQRRMETNPLRVIDCKSPTCRETVQNAPLILDTLCGDCREHFDAVRRNLEAVAVPYIVNPRLVRGLDYYSRTTFEAQTGDLGAQNAVAGGGRYDSLSLTLGGPDVPGTGFAAGLERLVMLLESKADIEAKGPALYIAALDEGAVEQAFRLTQQLRRRGLRVETDYSPGSLKSRMKRADRLGADRVLILGPEELEKGEGILRDMHDKSQENIVLAEALEQLARKIGA